MRLLKKEYFISFPACILHPFSLIPDDFIVQIRNMWLEKNGNVLKNLFLAYLFVFCGHFYVFSNMYSTLAFCIIYLFCFILFYFYFYFYFTFILPLSYFYFLAYSYEGDVIVIG